MAIPNTTETIQDLLSQLQTTSSSADLNLLEVAITVARQAIDDEGDHSDISIWRQSLCTLLSIRYDLRRDRKDLELLQQYAATNANFSKTIQEERERRKTAQDNLQDVLDYNEKLEEEMMSLRAMTKLLEDDLRAAQAARDSASDDATAAAASAADEEEATSAPSATGSGSAEDLKAKLRDECSCAICMELVYNAPVITVCCNTTMCAPCLVGVVTAAPDKSRSCPNCRGNPKVHPAGSMFAAVLRGVLDEEEAEEEKLDSNHQRAGCESVNALL